MSAVEFIAMTIVIASLSADALALLLEYDGEAARQFDEWCLLVGVE